MIIATYGVNLVWLVTVVVMSMAFTFMLMVRAYCKGSVTDSTDSSQCLDLAQYGKRVSKFMTLGDCEYGCQSNAAADMYPNFLTIHYLDNGRYYPVAAPAPIGGKGAEKKN